MNIPGLVEIDSFEGATDGAKLRNAMAYAAAQSQKPGLVVRPGATYDAGANPFQLYPGFKILGMAGGETEFSYNTRVNVRGTNGVFACVGTGATKGMLFKDIGFEGSINTVFLKDNPMDASGAYPGNSQIDGCSFDVFKHIYWGPISALQWFGTTYINNVKETALHVGGSDSVLFQDGGFLDHNGGTTREERLANKGLLRFSYLNKSVVGPIYTTGDPGLGVLVDGGGVGLVFQGSRFEGRNAGKPASGATIRVDSGHVTLRDVWAAYSMANPAENGRNDAGTIHVAGGSVLIDGAYYKRADGVGEDVPFVGVTGGRAVVRNIQAVGMSGAPVVRRLGGTVLADDTVRVVNG